MKTPGPDGAARPLLQAKDALWVSLSVWAGLVLMSLMDHLLSGIFFGGAGVWAVLAASALGGGLLAAALGLLSALFLPLWSRLRAQRPVLLFRLERSLAVVLWAELLWCLGDYLRDSRLPVAPPHPTIFFAGLVPSLALGAVVFRRTTREASDAALLRLRLSLLVLAYGCLLWLPRFSFFALQLALVRLVVVVIAVILGGLAGLWVRAPRRRALSLFLSVPLLISALFGWSRLSGSYWARDAAQRGGRLSNVSLQVAGALLLGEHNDLKALAQGTSTEAEPTSPAPPEPGPSLKEQLLQRKPKNLLVITVDALRADLGGVKASASAIQRLQREGLSFPLHRAGAANTIESMRTLFLGAYPWVPPTKSFFQIAREGGFFTLVVMPNAYILKLSGDWLRAGFDVLAYDLPVALPSAPVAMEMTTLLLQKLQDAGDKPFVAWVHYVDPHKPYDAEGDTDLERYAGEVLNNDLAIEALLEGLEARGLLENTLIALSADHGEEFGEHGGATHGLTLYEEIVRVPMILRAPGGGVRGELRHLTAAADVSPTLLSLMGLTAPEGFAPFGRDLFEADPERAVFSFRRLEPSAAVGDASVVKGRFKLLYNFDLQSAQLYDLSADPAERENLIEQQPALASMLAQALLIELQESGFVLP